MSLVTTSIRVPVDTIREASEKLKLYTDENEDLFSQILNRVNSVDSCGDWQGKSMKTLQSVTQKNQKKFESGMRELCQLASFLQNYANEMAEEDENQKVLIQRI